MSDLTESERAELDKFRKAKLERDELEAFRSHKAKLELPEDIVEIRSPMPFGFGQKKANVTEDGRIDSQISPTKILYIAVGVIFLITVISVIAVSSMSGGGAISNKPERTWEQQQEFRRRVDEDSKDAQENYKTLKGESLTDAEKESIRRSTAESLRMREYDKNH